MADIDAILTRKTSTPRAYGAGTQWKPLEYMKLKNTNSTCTGTFSLDFVHLYGNGNEITKMDTRK